MIANPERLKGIFVAFYACYNEAGRFDPDRARRLARWYVDQGVDGLYLTGSSGEGMMLSTEERMQTVETVCKAVGAQTKIIVHVGATTTREATELARHAAAVGADAISSVPNIYYALPEACIEAYWDALIEAAQIPFLIYNIPATTGYHLSMSLFERMIQKPWVAGIKTTSPNCALIQQMRRIGGEDVVIFNGEDAQLLAGLVMGASGGIGGTYGAMPELYVRLYRAYCRGDLARARMWQDRAALAMSSGRVSGSPGIASMKAILNARGKDCGGVRAPFRTVSPDAPEIRAAADRIESWLREEED